MEHLNRIEIQGIIGSVYVKDFVNAKVANLSVATEYNHTSQDGSIVIDVTWHRVVAWEGNRIQNLDQLTKGSAVHVMAVSARRNTSEWMDAREQPMKSWQARWKSSNR